MKTTKHKLATAAALVLSLLPAARGSAQNRGFALDQFSPSERGSEWFAADSLDLRGKLRPTIGLVGSWAYRPLVARDPNDNYERAIVRNQFVLHPGVSLVIVERLRLGVDLAVQPYADGRAATVGTTTFAPPENKSSLGDLRLAADVRLAGVYGDPITLAVGLQATLPTGDRDSYAGDNIGRIIPQIMVAGDISRFVYAARLAINIRPKDRAFFDTYVGSTAVINLAAGVRVVDRRLVIGPELIAQSVFTKGQFFDKNSTPIEALLGLHYTIVEGLRFGAGFGLGVTSSFRAPRHRGLLSIEWAQPIKKPPEDTDMPLLPPDRDLDHVLDIDDACPDQAGEAQYRGCPPPSDRDQDSVLDPQDACPDQAGPVNVDPQQNGCPPPDRDHDGVLDAQDACPDQAGVTNADPARNGCPAPTDRDQDGILDEQDACPDAAGNPDPDPARNGCPKAFVQGTQIKILDQVKFQKNKALIVPGRESEDVLRAVLQVLSEHSEIRSVRIEGHTDNTGSAVRNRTLSQERAGAVLNWLVKHGVDRARLASDGFGPDRPIDTNETEEGRQNNRRVDFQIESSTPPAQ
jgi:outer membrane protein OmpA-like peptidoglycan-associated protein